MSDQPTGYPRPAYAWYMVFLLLIIYTFSFIDRQILGLLGPSIKADFKISDTEFGVLTGYAFAIFYTVFGLFCARIADSRSRRGLITVGLIVWSIMTALGAFARDFIHLFLLRIGVGAGEATLAPAAGSLLADSFPKHRLATALSVYSMGIPVGSALAFIVGGWVIQIAAHMPDWTVPGLGTIGHWQKTFVLVGLPGILLALLIGTIKEPSRKGMVGAAKAVPVSEVARHMLSRFRAYAGICFGISAVAMLGFGTLMFLALFFNRFHGLNPAEVGKTFGSIAIITGPMGLLLGGTLADRLFRKGYKDAHIRAMIVAPLGFAIPAMTLPFIQDTHVVWMVLAVSNLFLNLPSGVAFAGLHIITPNQMRGQVTAFYVLCTNIIGYGSGPWLIGFFTDHVFGDEMKLNYSMALVAAITTPLCLGLLLWGRKAFAKAVIAEEERLAEQS
ncbi:spinster family MFS transporter [Kordiimonas marina]|uniref:spinster family MFS transporter n=1 Tax=Kordiimonas marina TaxID=2872312 RepID=UPI001FF670AC|nr:MFS transporter [Kordiimonas marina]MCJ9428290.1 MFS transporter [Kordiimonas marina]